MIARHDQVSIAFQSHNPTNSAGPWYSGYALPVSTIHERCLNYNSTETSRETNADDLLQVAPGVLERFHREPGVRVRADVEALDLLVKLCQLVEVLFGSAQRRLELVVGLAQSLSTNGRTLGDISFSSNFGS